MTLIFLKKHFYTQRMQMMPHFLLKDKKSVVELMKSLAGSGALRGAKLALSGMECMDLMFNALKNYSCDKNFENQENFINQVLKTEKL